MPNKIKYEKPKGLSLGEVAPIRGETPCGDFGRSPQTQPACQTPGFQNFYSCGPSGNSASITCTNTGSSAIPTCQTGSSASPTCYNTGSGVG